MPAKTITKKPPISKTKKTATHKNGSQAPDEHLVKANKAMAKAWTLISRRQDKRD